MLVDSGKVASGKEFHSSMTVPMPEGILKDICTCIGFPAKLNHGFSLFNMQICKFLVAIAVVVINNLAVISKATCLSL